MSALHGYGLEGLRQRIETGVMETTGRIAATIRVNLESAQLRYVRLSRPTMFVNLFQCMASTNQQCIYLFILVKLF